MSRAAVPITPSVARNSNDECSKIRSEVNAAKKAELDRKSAIIESKLPELTLRSVNQAKEKEASSWLSVLPLKDQGFSLHKGNLGMP